MYNYILCHYNYLYGTQNSTSLINIVIAHQTIYIPNAETNAA